MRTWLFIALVMPMIITHTPVIWFQFVFNFHFFFLAAHQREEHDQFLLWEQKKKKSILFFDRILWRWLVDLSRSVASRYRPNSIACNWIEIFRLLFMFLHSDRWMVAITKGKKGKTINLHLIGRRECGHVASQRYVTGRSDHKNVWCE